MKQVRMYIKYPIENSDYKVGTIVEVSLNEARLLAGKGALVADKKLEEMAKKAENQVKEKEVKEEVSELVVEEVKEEVSELVVEEVKEDKKSSKKRK